MRSAGFSQSANPVSSPSICWAPSATAIPSKAARTPPSSRPRREASTAANVVVTTLAQTTDDTSATATANTTTATAGPSAPSPLAAPPRVKAVVSAPGPTRAAAARPETMVAPRSGNRANLLGSSVSSSPAVNRGITSQRAKTSVKTSEVMRTGSAALSMSAPAPRPAPTPSAAERSHIKTNRTIPMTPERVTPRRRSRSFSRTKTPTTPSLPGL